ncbi:MAG: hypothetical protein NVS9B15_02840 [Acidobacteriaceae bacterium]
MFKRMFQRTTTPSSPEAEMPERVMERANPEETLPEPGAPEIGSARTSVQPPQDAQPPANELLVQAMLKVAQNDTRETRVGLYEAFLQGFFWMPIAAPPEGVEAGQQVDGGAQVQVPGLQDQEGNKLLAVFTDGEALGAFIPNSPYLAVPTRDFFRMAAGTDIQYVAVNPWPPNGEPVRPGGRLMRFEVEALARGEMPGLPPQAGHGEVPAGQQVAVSKADSPLSQSAVEELRKAAQYEPIRKIYYLQVQMAPNPAAKTLAFELTHTPPQSVVKDMFEALANRLRPYLEGFDALQFITVEGEGAVQCGQAGETVYVRER